MSTHVRDAFAPALFAFALAVLAALSPLRVANAQGEIVLDAQQEARFSTLTEELRCLVCQNQSIAESNAALAKDLKDQVREQIAAGRSDAQIRSYMRERYGDFVLYKPPVNAVTALLWASPVLLLLIAGLVLMKRLRRAQPEDFEDDEETP